MRITLLILKNKYRYVYVSKHDDFQDATAMYFSDINGKYKDAMWIMTVNKDNSDRLLVYKSVNNNNNNQKLNNSITIVTTNRRNNNEEKV